MIWSIDYDSPTSERDPSFPPNGGEADDGGYACSVCDIVQPVKGDSFDPQDLSSIKKLAAIGDSYSAGIGAGNRLGSIFDAFTKGNGMFASPEFIR